MPKRGDPGDPPTEHETEPKDHTLGMLVFLEVKFDRNEKICMFHCIT